jgi:chemotaxis signal transduction protein
MATSVLMIIKTALRRYAVRRDDLLDVKMAQAGDTFQVEGSAERPYIGFELGPLLDPADCSSLKRRRALIVPLRRRYIALMVDNIDTFLEQADTIALPALLRERLHEPWAVGALVLEDDLVVQLDLRAVARSALLGYSSRNK